MKIVNWIDDPSSKAEHSLFLFTAGVRDSPGV